MAAGTFCSEEGLNVANRTSNTKFRKERIMIQEKMVFRLRVATPAVNKWENGNSYPDIMMLALIA